MAAVAEMDCCYSGGWGGLRLLLLLGKRYDGFAEMDCCYFGCEYGGRRGDGLLLLRMWVWRPLLGWTVATSDGWAALDCCYFWGRGRAAAPMAAAAEMDCCYFGEEVWWPLLRWTVATSGKRYGGRC